jgi:hypothetical protein
MLYTVLTDVSEIAIAFIFMRFLQLCYRYTFLSNTYLFFSFGATAHILALAYLHETFRFTSVY